MSIYKDNVTGKWRVVYRYTDWTGKTKQTSKRGFPTKREAQMWEHEQMLKHDAKLDMTFASFYEIYVEDKKERIRDNTWGTKNNIARTKILPYFGERKIAEIEPKDVIAWQNHCDGILYSVSVVKISSLSSRPSRKGETWKENHRYRYPKIYYGHCSSTILLGMRNICRR